MWNAPLPLANLTVVTFGGSNVVGVGSEPNPVHDVRSEISRESHEKIVAIDLGSGAVSSFDLTAESALESDRERDGEVVWVHGVTD